MFPLKLSEKCSFPFYNLLQFPLLVIFVSKNISIWRTTLLKNNILLPLDAPSSNRLTIARSTLFKIWSRFKSSLTHGIRKLQNFSSPCVSLQSHLSIFIAL